jgi:hypothetical protein
MPACEVSQALTGLIFNAAWHHTVTMEHKSYLSIRET